jgi:hypothetical protein
MRASVAATATEPPSRDVVVVGPTTARLDDADKNALRAIVREELAAERAAAAASASTTAADDPQQWQLSDAAMKSYDVVHARVDDAITRGAWTPDDRDALRLQLGNLPAEARVEALRPLVVAVNDGRVRFTGHGPLF